jgi:hypothetical protein
MAYISLDDYLEYEAKRKAQNETVKKNQRTLQEKSRAAYESYKAQPQQPLKYQKQPQNDVYIPAQFGQRILDRQRQQEYANRLYNTYIPATLAQDALNRSGRGNDFNAFSDSALRSDYLLNSDTAKMRTELDALSSELSLDEQRYNRMKAKYALYGNNVNDSGAKAIKRYLDEYEAKSNKAEQLRRNLSDAEKAQKYAGYEALRQNTDFAEKSKAGKSKRVQFSLTDPSTWAAGDDRYDFINNIDGYRDHNLAGLEFDNAKVMGMERNLSEHAAVSKMTDGEIAMYNYLYATKGRKAADEYIDTIAEGLNYKLAQDDAANVGDNVLKGMSYGFQSGVERFGTGVADMFRGEATPTSATEYGSQLVRENLADSGLKLPEFMGGSSVGQVAFDMANTAGNMAPSILLATLTGGLGATSAVSGGVASASMGLSAGGSAKMQALRQGYSNEQATKYGLLIGASEGALQYLLGGISKLGGRFTGGIASRAIQNIDNALLRVAASGAIKMAGEGTEEYLQEILDPIYRNLLFDERNQIDLTDPNAVYSFMLGALTSGVMESQNTVRDLAGAVRTEAAKARERAATPNINGALVGSNSLVQDSGTDTVNTPTAQQTTANTGVATAETAQQNTNDNVTDINPIDAPAQAQAPVNEQQMQRGDSSANQEQAIPNLDRMEAYRGGREISDRLQDYKKRHERNFIARLSETFNIPKDAQKDLMPMLSSIGDSVIRSGQLSQEDSDMLFEAVFDSAMEYDGKSEYQDFRKYLHDSAVRPDSIPKEYRKEARRFLNLRNDGKSITQLYEDISKEFPGFLDESSTSQEDMLSEIIELNNNMRGREYTLKELYGDDYESMKMAAKIDFEQDLYELRKKMNLVDRADVVRHAERIANERAKLDSMQYERVSESLSKIKSLKRDLESVRNKYPTLTRGDMDVIASLHSGGITLSDIEKRANYDEIKAVYEAESGLMKEQKIVELYNKQRRESLREDAMEALENSDDWKDKKHGVMYARETQQRNIQDIVNDSTDADLINARYFDPVKKNEADKTRYINEMTERVKAFGLNKWESKAAQMVGEKASYEESLANGTDDSIIEMYEEGLSDVNDALEKLLEKHGKDIDLAKCENAAKEMRPIFEELFEKANEALIRNGYAPIEHRKGYFPHFIGAEDSTVRAELFNVLGKNQNDIPTDIAGLTATFRPGKTWFGNALERVGVTTTYDLHQGFDKYMRGIADIIYHTDDIQRLRSLDNAIRYKYSDAGRKAKINDINNNLSLTPEERANQINLLYSKASISHLSNYAANLTDYTNGLAGKKTDYDRVPEKLFSRKIYQLSKFMDNRFSANATGGNIGVALSNFIPFTQALSQLGTVDMLNAMKETVKSYSVADGFVDKSDFLTSRKGTEQLFVSDLKKLENAASVPFEVVDMFVAESIVRAKYNANIKSGMSEDAAMKNANDFAGGLIADRSKGALPTIFNSKSTLAKTFTMFQVEVNNQLSYMFKDMPRAMKDKGIGAIAYGYFKMFLAAFLFNELDEKYGTGRRRALDPIGLVRDAVVDFTGGDDGKTSKADAAINLWSGIAGEIPFVGNILGGDGGRSHIESMIPSITNIVKAIGADDADSAYVGQQIGNELAKPLYYLIPPLGGAQAKKTYEGIEAFINGGSYRKNKQGEEQLQYAVDQNIANLIRMGLFGKWSTESAQDYIDSGFKMYSVKHTQAYTNAKENGVDGSHALMLIDEYKALKPEKNEQGETTKSTSEQFREILFNDKDLTPEQKAMFDRDVIGANKTADYSDSYSFKASQLSGKGYERYNAYVEAGIKKADALEIAEWKRSNSGKEKTIEYLKKYNLTQRQIDAVLDAN